MDNPEALGSHRRRRAGTKAHTWWNTHSLDRKTSGRSCLTLDCCILGRSRTQLLQTFRRNPSAYKTRAGVRRAPMGSGRSVLTTASSSEAVQFFHEPLTAEDCARFSPKLGDAKGQQYWRALSVLVGLKLWGSLVAKSQAVVKVRSDSVTAWQCTAKVGKLLTASEWNWSRNRLCARSPRH